MKEFEALKRGEIYDKNDDDDVKNDKRYDSDECLDDEKYNRFYDPEIEFKKLVETNKEINKGLKEGKRYLLDLVERKKLDESMEMFNKAFHP